MNTQHQAAQLHPIVLAMWQALADFADRAEAARLAEIVR